MRIPACPVVQMRICVCTIGKQRRCVQQGNKSSNTAVLEDRGVRGPAPADSHHRPFKVPPVVITTTTIIKIYFNLKVNVSLQKYAIVQRASGMVRETDAGLSTMSA